MKRKVGNGCLLTIINFLNTWYGNFLFKRTTCRVNCKRYQRCGAIWTNFDTKINSFAIRLIYSLRNTNNSVYNSTIRAYWIWWILSWAIEKYIWYELEITSDISVHKRYGVITRFHHDPSKHKQKMIKIRIKRMYSNLE